MKQQPPASQPTIEQMVRTADQLFKNQDYEQAMQVLERARRLDPANLGVLLELGRVCGSRYDYTAADQWFENAVAVAPAHRQADVLAMAGLLCRNFRRYEMAVRYLERAARTKPASPD